MLGRGVERRVCTRPGACGAGELWVCLTVARCPDGRARRVPARGPSQRGARGWVRRAAGVAGRGCGARGGRRRAVRRRVWSWPSWPERAGFAVERGARVGARGLRGGGASGRARGGIAGPARRRRGSRPVPPLRAEVPTRGPASRGPGRPRRSVPGVLSEARGGSGACRAYAAHHAAGPGQVAGGARGIISADGRSWLAAGVACCHGEVRLARFGIGRCWGCAWHATEGGQAVIGGESVDGNIGGVR